MVMMGARMITDDPRPVDNPQVLRRAMEYARDFGLLVASHATTPALWQGGAMNEGTTSYALGLPGIPAIAEEIAIARDIALARHTGCPLHIQHVSTARGMDIIRRAKEEGVAVTCEVTPHHLIFTEAAVGDYDTRYKMDPPLRLDEDRAALLVALRDGTADVITSDHAPHTEFEKNNDFASAPFGITGLETALPSLFDRFISKGIFGWDLIVKRYSAEPRRLFKFDPVPIQEGGTAEFIVFNPSATSTFTRDFMKSKSINTPFLNKTLQGLVERVIRNGEEILSR